MGLKWAIFKKEQRFKTRARIATYKLRLTGHGKLPSETSKAKKCFQGCEALRCCHVMWRI